MIRDPRDPLELRGRRNRGRFARRFAFLLLAGALAVPLSSAGQAAPIGPIRGAEQNPLYRLMYVPEVQGADVLDAGQWRWELVAQYSSVFEDGFGDTHRQLFDLERLGTGAALRHGLGDGWEVGGEITFVTEWRGFLDPFVGGFHELLGVPNGGREDHPNDRYLFELEHIAHDGPDETPSVVVLDLEPRTFELEDAELFVRWRFLGEPGDPTVLSLGATARLSGGPFDAGRLSGGVAVSGRVTGEATHAHFQSGIALLNPPGELRAIANRRAFQSALGIEHQLRPRLSLLGQLVAGTPYFDGFEGGDLEGAPMTLTLGLGGRAGSAWEWRLGLSEDILFGGPSVDFTVGLQVSRTSGG